MLRSKLIVLISLMAGVFSAANVNAVTIFDNYVGTDILRGTLPPHNPPQDVYGSTAVNGITSADLNSDGKNLIVKISTSFWDGYHGYHYGDLFISTHGYTAPADSNTDDGNGTGKWDYVFATASENLYKITPGFVASNSLVRNNPTFSSANPMTADPTAGTHWVARLSGGETVDHLAGAFLGNPAATGENPSSGTFIQYTIPWSDLGPATNGRYDLGIRWSQTCGNDIIEGGAVLAVPEVNTYGLVLAGLIIVGWIVRRRMPYSGAKASA